ncbi:MAG: DUF4962 domain-containing protein [Phycisphaerae bacterium]|nr:DUF4962 domain-containing protein [Phycisphaerae bacterium]
MARVFWTVLAVVMVAGPVATAEELVVDDRAGTASEWGFRPADESTSATTPPSFVWKPQKRARSYALQCARDRGFTGIEYEASGIDLNCHCPPKALAEGQWYWRFRFEREDGKRSQWSQIRHFAIPKDAVELPMPAREELIARIPKAHPRLFVRPEEMATLRERAKADLRPHYEAMVKQCERLLKKPPSTEEPPKYPKGTVRKGEEWRKIWWGNRERTRAVLESASILGFTRLLGGKEEYGQLAKRLLLAAAAWDPLGATDYRYNDEAGMPYAYYFSRAYTFVNDLLSEAEKAKCREVMRIRGKRMYDHLCPSHLWRPYASHSNRAWHFLGEVGIAFLGEIPEAEAWTWFAVNVFFNVYPVWCDDDGGWHEGVSYWRSYVFRFTWWADVMRAAMGIDAYKKPYFSKVGYYPMYLQPPGTVGGGFGDLCGTKRAEQNRQLMTVLAAQSGNGYWQWYVDAIGGRDSAGGYVGFVRGVLPKVAPKPPTDLPTSRCFHGIGQAMLNTTLFGAKDNVEVIFKSSPFGSISHGYESSNAFLLYAYGERLLVRTGQRDVHGSKHHMQWMHDTKSVNCITINDRSQTKHSSGSAGRITQFHTSDTFDHVCGEAGGAYGDLAERFTRHILFVKPELIVIYDRLGTPAPATFQWRLHAMKEMAVRGQGDIQVRSGGAACRVSFMAPEGLRVSQTDKFEPPPRERIKLTQYHVTAGTLEPAKRCEFVTLIRPHRVGQAPPTGATIEKTSFGYRLACELSDGRVVIGLRSTDGVEMAFDGLRAGGDVAAIRVDAGGGTRGTFAGQ